MTYESSDMKMSSRLYLGVSIIGWIVVVLTMVTTSSIWKWGTTVEEGEPETGLEPLSAPIS